MVVASVLLLHFCCFFSSIKPFSLIVCDVSSTIEYASSHFVCVVVKTIVYFHFSTFVLFVFLSITKIFERKKEIQHKHY